MKKLVIPIAAAVVGLSTSLALAEEATGQILEFDQATGRIVLDSGQAFTLQEGASMEGLEPGTEVTVSYEIDADTGEAVATEVQPH